MQALPVSACIVGESPLWHPTEQVLYWCDIVGRRLHRFDPSTSEHRQWDFESDVACCAPREAGGLMLARRDGLWTFDPRIDEAVKLADAPYDTSVERFNDGKAGPDGAFWVGTIYEPRDKPAASLYRWHEDQLQRIVGEVTVSNGLAWSPDGATMYWSDTWGHTIYTLRDGGRRIFKTFPRREPGASLDHYGGRPDGAAMDAEGCLWVAMFEGARLLRLSPAGEILQSIELPVRCPTMPCFGGSDLQTLYITTASEKRPPEELAAMPLSGRVLTLRVDVPGLPANFVK